LLSVVVSTQAGWFDNAKNWLKKAEQKIKNIVTGSEKEKPIPPVVVLQPAKKVPPVVPPRKNVPPVVAPKPKMASSLSVVAPSVGNNFSENVKLISAMAKLRKRAETVLASHANLYEPVIMQINQMIKGFKRTNGVLSGEETIAMLAINNMSTVLNDLEAGRVSSEHYVTFMNDTFDWWKRTYFTEEMFNEDSSRSYDLTDEEWEAQEDALWNDEDNDTDFEENLKIGNTMVTEEEQQAVFGALSRGLLKNKRN